MTVCTAGRFGHIVRGAHSTSGSKLDKISIIQIILIMIHLQKFILYSISVIKINIVDRRLSIIKINFLIKTCGAKNIIFIKSSIPKLITLHIISIKIIQRRHTKNVATIVSVMQIIKLHSLLIFSSNTSCPNSR